MEEEEEEEEVRVLRQSVSWSSSRAVEPFGKSVQ